MNAPPRRVEHLQTDKGNVPVYTTAVVEQPWASYAPEDHATWAALFERQQQVLADRAAREFLDNQRKFGMTPDAIPKFDDLNRVLKKDDRLGIGRRRGPAAGTHVFRPPREPAFPGDLVDPPPGPDRLHQRTRSVPRSVRPRAAAAQPGIRRLHAGLWLRRRQGARHRRGGAGESHAPVLVHGRVRTDQAGRRPAHLRLRHRQLEGRVDPLPGIACAEPHRFRPQAHHAHALPHRYLPEDLFRHRQLPAADGCDRAGLHPDLRRTRAAGLDSRRECAVRRHVYNRGTGEGWASDGDV